MVNPQEPSRRTYADRSRELPPPSRSVAIRLQDARLALSRVGGLTVVLIILGLIFISIVLLPSIILPQPRDIATIADAAARVQATTAFEQARNAVRTTLIQAIAGALIFVTAFVAWLQVRTARQGQLVDRFTKSIDQLGSDKVEVRLGGIYALSQLAENTKYRKPIAEIFSAFLRSRSSDSETKALKSKRGGVEVDAQAVLDVLIRQNLWGNASETALNLSGVVMQGAQLSYARMEGCVLRRALLDGADLRGADLRQSDLRGARLVGADLREARLDNALMTDCDLTGANLYNAYLSDIVAERANLANAILRRADLTRADFSDASMSGVDMQGAEGADVVFVGANLSRATIVDTAFERVSLDARTQLAEATFDTRSKEQFPEQVAMP